MKPYIANIINGVILVFLGLLGAKYAMETFPDPSMAIYIMPIIGSLLLIMTPGIKKESETVLHIAIVLTFCSFLMLLFFPLRKCLANSPRNMEQILRVTTMCFSCLLALVVFVKGFLKSRKAN